MITLIGFRCTHSNVLSHEVLIRPSRPETQTSQYMFATFTHLNLFYFTVLKIEMWREVSSETPSMVCTRKVNSEVAASEKT